MALCFYINMVLGLDSDRNKLFWCHSSICLCIVSKIALDITLDIMSFVFVKCFAVFGF